MPIDNSIYQQGIPDIMGAAKSALEVRNQREQKARQQKADQSAEQARQVEAIARIAPTIKDQDSYDNAIGVLRDQHGVDVSKMPGPYDPGLVNQYAAAALSAKDQADNQLKREGYANDAANRKSERDARLAMFDQGLNDKREARWERAQERADARRDKDEALNATQSKQMGLYKSGKMAEDQYKNAVADKSKYDPTSVGQWIDNSQWAPRWMKNDKAIESQAAQGAWVESFLRDASGAAIPAGERLDYAVDFFPQPGDTDAVVANKAELRRQKMENALMGAGKPGRTELANQGAGGPNGAPQLSQQDLAMAELMRRKQAKQTAGR